MNRKEDRCFQWMKSTNKRVIILDITLGGAPILMIEKLSSLCNIPSKLTIIIGSSIVSNNKDVSVCLKEISSYSRTSASFVAL